MKKTLNKLKPLGRRVPSSGHDLCRAEPQTKKTNTPGGGHSSAAETVRYISV